VRYISMFMLLLANSFFLCRYDFLLPTFMFSCFSRAIEELHMALQKPYKS
jgi:hypothetical protein